MDKIALAIAAQTEDIEFLMAGTLVLFKNVGYEIHYMNLFTGNCGISNKIPDTSVPMSVLADHPNVQFKFYRPGLGTCSVEMH